MLKQSLIAGDFHSQDNHHPQQAEVNAIPACRQPVILGLLLVCLCCVLRQKPGVELS